MESIGGDGNVLRLLEPWKRTLDVLVRRSGRDLQSHFGSCRGQGGQTLSLASISADDQFAATVPSEGVRGDAHPPAFDGTGPSSVAGHEHLHR